MIHVTSIRDVLKYAIQAVYDVGHGAITADAAAQKIKELEGLLVLGDAPESKTCPVGGVKSSKCENAGIGCTSTPCTEANGELLSDPWCYPSAIQKTLTYLIEQINKQHYLNAVQMLVELLGLIVKIHSQVLKGGFVEVPLPPYPAPPL